MVLHFDFQSRGKKKLILIKKEFKNLFIVFVDFHQIPFHLLHRWLIENVVEYFVVMHRMVELASQLLNIAFALLMYRILIEGEREQLNWPDR
jgi:hypothetical protein